HKEFRMIRPMIWRALALAVFAAGAPPAHAAEVYQVSTISSLLAGGYDGDTSVAELLRHGGFGLGTFNGVDGEMMVLDGRVYRGTVDGHTHAVELDADPICGGCRVPPAGLGPGRGRTVPRATGGGARCAALQRVARPCGAGRRAFSNHRGAQRAQTAASLSPLAPRDQGAAGRTYLRRGRRSPDRLPFPGEHDLRQRAWLALPFYQRRPRPRRPCPWPDHRRGPGLAGGILRPAHQLARPGPGIERRRGRDQGGGTPPV